MRQLRPQVTVLPLTRPMTPHRSTSTPFGSARPSYQLTNTREPSGVTAIAAPRACGVTKLRALHVAPASVDMLKKTFPGAPVSWTK